VRGYFRLFGEQSSVWKLPVTRIASQVMRSDLSPQAGRGDNPLLDETNQSAPVQPPVTLMCRLTLGRLCLRSMMKSWPFGFSAMA
jgi:hypothetical protein